MMSAHRLRVRVMHTGSVMMGDARLHVAVMMMRVLSLMLLEAHQALAGLQARAVTKVISVLVNVSVHVPVEVPVHATLHHRGLVMMLIRIQHLLYALQLVLATVLLLRRQAGMSVLQLLVQILASAFEEIRAGFQQRTGSGGQAVLVILQV